MESRQCCCHIFTRMLCLGANEDQEQQHGEIAMVLKAGEEEGKKGLVQSELAQGELGQGELALGELAPSKPAQEELAQSGLTQEATGVVEEGENEEEEMEGGHAGDGSSGPMDKGIQAEGGHGSSIEQQPQQEAAMPEGTNSLQAGDNLSFQSQTRFTESQLQDLERLFEENRFPSFQVRKALARSMDVQEEDVQVLRHRCSPHMKREEMRKRVEGTTLRRDLNSRMERSRTEKQGRLEKVLLLLYLHASWMTVSVPVPIARRMSVHLRSQFLRA
ncbi:homeobox protein Rhox5-like [Peromyscus californicus insignis]|uniref:homeobox protein Rhox5-like n=1 Tax=Peromyscus californicus insignis TaxID=564181 RepID=UPI0022A7E7B0|nr:homeobox protein Rhox5-like [Peromyscus californicus insignis]